MLVTGKKEQPASKAKKWSNVKQKRESEKDITAPQKPASYFVLMYKVNQLLKAKT